jgi:hypothetical protein
MVAILLASDTDERSDFAVHDAALDRASVDPRSAKARLLDE